MKILKVIILAMGIMTSTSPVYSRETSDGEPQGSGIPIILHKTKDTPKQHLPSKGIDILLTVSDDMLYLALPFDGYPMEVKIEGIEETSGFWSSTLSYAGEEVPFDGEPGEYILTLTTADNSIYVGYFSID